MRNKSNLKTLILDEDNDIEIAQKLLKGKMKQPTLPSSAEFKSQIKQFKLRVSDNKIQDKFNR